MTAPLDPRLVRLLDAEREVPKESPARIERVLDRVRSSVAGGTGGAPLSPGLSGRQATALATVTFLLGGALGLWFGRSGVDTERVSSPVVLPASPATTAPPAAQPSLPVQPEPTSSVVARARPAPATVAAREPTEQLAAATTLDRERQLLDVARAAVRERNANVALDAVDRHAHEFPSGLLFEERLSLEIQALMLIGDRPTAETRAARFRELFPRSIFLSTTAAALTP